MLATISGRGLSLISAKCGRKQRLALQRAWRVWAAPLTSSPHSFWRRATGRKDELQFGSQIKQILYRHAEREIWSGFIHSGGKQHGQVVRCECICMLRETGSYTDWFPPEVILDCPHLKDVTGKNCNSRDVTDCRAARKRALSCLLDVCPAGHAHR